MQDRLFKIMSSIFEISIEEINENSSPDTIANWDSMKHVNLVLTLEEEFGVFFSDEQIVGMMNVKTIIETLKEMDSI